MKHVTINELMLLHKIEGTPEKISDQQLVFSNHYLSGITNETICSSLTDQINETVTVLSPVLVTKRTYADGLSHHFVYWFSKEKPDHLIVLRVLEFGDRLATHGQAYQQVENRMFQRHRSITQAVSSFEHEYVDEMSRHVIAVLIESNEYRLRYITGELR